MEGEERGRERVEKERYTSNTCVLVVEAHNVPVLMMDRVIWTSQEEERTSGRGGQ